MTLRTVRKESKELSREALLRVASRPENDIIMSPVCKLSFLFVRFGNCEVDLVFGVRFSAIDGFRLESKSITRKSESFVATSAYR